MIVNNEQPKETPTAPVKEVAENTQPLDAPKGEPQEAPKRTFNKERAYDYLWKLSEANGSKLSQEEVDQLSSEFMNRSWSKIYRKVGAELPSDDDLISTYDSFWDAPENTMTVKPEGEEVAREPLESADVKKKSGSGSPSTTEDGQVSLESSLPGIESDTEKVAPAAIPFKSNFKETSSSVDYIAKSDMSWFNMSESDAEVAFNAQYGRFGFRAEQARPGTNALTIHAPGNTGTKELRLYTDGYKKTSGTVGDSEFREDYHKQDILNWMQNSSESVFSMVESSLTSGSQEEVDFALKSTYSTSTMFPYEESEKLRTALGDNLYNLQINNGEFVPTFVPQAINFRIQELRNELKNEDSELRSTGSAQTVSSEVRASTPILTSIKRSDILSKIDFLNEELALFNSRSSRNSELVGASLLNTGAYKRYDVANSEAEMAKLIYLGVKPQDFPLDQIQLNGRAATFNEAFRLMTDFDAAKRFRTGELSIEVSGIDEVSNEAVKGMLESISSLKERNDLDRQYGAFGKDSKVGHWLQNTARGALDVVQQLGISAERVLSETAYGIADGLKALGLEEESVDAAIFGPAGLGKYGTATPAIMHPSALNSLSEELLPLYGSKMTDAESFGEMMFKGSDALAASLPITTLFMVNPATGLLATSTSSYGGALYDTDLRINQAKEAGDLERLADLELSNLSKMSRAEARTYALTMAGIETAVTRVFTYNFFKGAASAKNFAGTKNAVNAQGLADAYSKRYFRGFISKTARQLGIEPRALANEISEEEFIALGRYAVEVNWGLRKYDHKEVLDLVAETGAQSAFSSIGISKIARANEGKKIDEAVDNLIERNISIEGEAEIVNIHMRSNAALERELSKPMRKPTAEPGREFIGEESGPSREQVKGKVVAQPKTKPNQGDIDYLNGVLDETSAKLLDYKKRKQELISSMSREDKKDFLSMMGEIERIQLSMERNTEGFESIASIRKITDLRGKAREILVKYPSDLSFQYLRTAQQEQLKQKAVDQIIKERFKGNAEGVSYEIIVRDPEMPAPEMELDESDLDITDEEITKVAVELFKQGVRDGEINSSEEVTVLPGFNTYDMYRHVHTMTPRERSDFNLSSNIATIRQMQNAGVIDFGKPVEKEVKSDELEVNEILDFTGAQLPVVDNTMVGDEEVEVTLDSEVIADIDNKKEVVPGSETKTGIELKNSLTEENKATENQRISALMDKMAYYDNEGNFLTNLSINQQEDIITFFKDVKSGNRGNIGKIESIVDAFDLAVDIKSSLPADISVFSPEAQSMLVKQMTTLSQKMAAGVYTKETTLATTTILMETLFPDARSGKSFYKINEEAGRIVDVIKQSVATTKQEHTTSYQKDAEQDLAEFGGSKEDVLNPNSLYNSYEMYVLGSLYRMSGKKGSDGLDTEFSRNKGLILQELKARKEDYEASKSAGKEASDVALMRYKKWEEIVRKLNVEQANSYEDVSAKASRRNSNAITRMSEMQPNQEALNRIQDFNRFNPTVMSRYLPNFYKVGGQGNGYVDAFGIPNDDGRQINANQAKDVTLPYDLNGENELRLNPGMYYDQMYGSLQGLRMDIEGRKTYRTISNLMDMPQFQSMFDGNSMDEDGRMHTTAEYEIIANAFRKREYVFDNDIRTSHMKSVDFGDADFSIVKKLGSSLYSSTAANSLVRLSQNMSQFQSAVSGTFPNLTSKEAGSHLRKRTALFYVGLSGATNGSSNKKFVSKWISKNYGTGGYAANIFKQSRTGLRNGLNTELIIDPAKKYPLDYYLRHFKLIDAPKGDPQNLLGQRQGPGTEVGFTNGQRRIEDAVQRTNLLENKQKLIDGEQGNVFPSAQDVDEASKREEPRMTEEQIYQILENKGMPRKAGAYSLSQVLDGIQSSNELSLELFLANGDRAAANATFEAYYIDYRVKNGAKYDPSNPKAFWEAENANPNIEAINHADRMIDRTQRQSTTTSEAGMYSDYASTTFKNVARTIMPFSRFTTNVRTDIANQMAIINDPTISEDQKKVAKNVLQGKVNEITFFAVSRSLSAVALTNGFAGLMVQGGLVDDEDVERYGGMTGLIGNYMLPIEDRDIEGPVETPISQAGSLEEQQVIMRQYSDALSGMSSTGNELSSLLMTYENKLKLSYYEPKILRDLTQETLETMVPVVRPGGVDDAVAILFNLASESVGSDLEANEFLSRDLKGIETKEGFANFLANNAGMLSIKAELINSFVKAHEYKFGGYQKKFNPLSPDGTIKVGVSAMTEPQREQLENTINMLYAGRLLQTVPTGPVPIVKGDLNKLLNRLDRQIETFFDAVETEDGLPTGDFELFQENQQKLKEEDLGRDTRRSSVLTGGNQ